MLAVSKEEEEEEEEEEEMLADTSMSQIP